MTQFGRALEALTIEIICAHSQQAKGRVERANGTLQDHFVKAMRLAGISSIETDNAFLPSYVEKHNQHFARPAFDSRDLHRPLAPHDELTAIMVWREQRTVTSALTLHYNKAMFILEPCELTRALALARQMQAAAPHHRQRNNDAPSRRSQATHIFPEPETPAKIDRRRSGNSKLKPRPRLSEAELRSRGTLEFAMVEAEGALPAALCAHVPRRVTFLNGGESDFSKPHRDRARAAPRGNAEQNLFMTRHSFPQS